MRSVQYYIPNILSLQGFHSVTSDNQLWPRQRTRDLDLNQIDMHAACRIVQAWILEILYLQGFQTMTYVDVSQLWPPLKRIKLFNSDVVYQCRVYKITPSLQSWDIVVTGYFQWKLCWSDNHHFILIINILFWIWHYSICMCQTLPTLYIKYEICKTFLEINIYKVLTLFFTLANSKWPLTSITDKRVLELNEILHTEDEICQNFTSWSIMFERIS